MPKIKFSIFERAVYIIDTARQKIVDTIYNESTESYFLLGKLIVEEEQSGNNKAKYGEAIIEKLSKELTLKYGKGFSKSTLKDCRKFYQKSQSLTDQFNFKLSFTHYSFLIRLDGEEMQFYEKFAIEHKLSVRELRSAVQSNTILRHKSDLKTKSKSNILQPKDIIKDPYILDFLGLENEFKVKENILEGKLVEHLEKFLLELGRGFAFVGRQFRITLAEDSYWADLVFYNIPLKCYVIFELKTRKLRHQDIGQLQMYVNYFDRDIRDETDNPTLGVLLCNDKNETVVKYTLPNDNQTIFASKFSLYLPTKEELMRIVMQSNEV